MKNDEYKTLIIKAIDVKNPRKTTSLVIFIFVTMVGIFSYATEAPFDLSSEKILLLILGTSLYGMMFYEVVIGRILDIWDVVHHRYVKFLGTVENYQAYHTYYAPSVNGNSVIIKIDGKKKVCINIDL